MGIQDKAEFKRQKQLYIEKNHSIEATCQRVEQADFYRFLFPIGSFERKGHPEDAKPNGLALDIHGQGKAFHCIITDELSELKDITEKSDFLIMSPIGYFGSNRSSRNARYLYAYTIDLDRVEMPNLRDLFHQMSIGFIPTATFIVNSGTGLHLYYVFEEPIALYPRVQEMLKIMKYALIHRIWNGYTSSDENVQQQGILQGFRVVGSPSKLGRDYPVCAFKFGQRVTIEYLNQFVPDVAKIHDLYYKKNSLSLDEAKEKYPDWYEKRIVNQRPTGRWSVKRDVYDWWKSRIPAEIVAGHRFFSIFALAIYAKKCNILEEELRADAYGLIEILDTRTTDARNHFTEDDVISALEAYNENFVTFPRDDIGKLTGLIMPVNKRNGRAQTQHLQIMTAVRDIVHPNGEWRNSKGRPSKQNAIQDYILENPETRIGGVAEALHVSRNTVKKYYDYPTVGKMTESYLQDYPDASISEIMDMLGVSKSTAYKYSKIYGKKERP